MKSSTSGAPQVPGILPKSWLKSKAWQVKNLILYGCWSPQSGPPPFSQTRMQQTTDAQ